MSSPMSGHRRIRGDRLRMDRLVRLSVIYSLESNRVRKRARLAAPSSDGDAVLALQEVRPGDAGTPADCAVCLQDFVAEDRLRAMPCSHAFHQDCISRWLRVNRVCPLCRHALPTQPQQQDDQDEDEEGDEADDEAQVYAELAAIEQDYPQRHSHQYYHRPYGAPSYRLEAMPVPEDA